MKTKQETSHVRRRGLGRRFKRACKRFVRKAVVRRWAVILAVKIVSWLIKRLWSDWDHSNLSP